MTRTTRRFVRWLAWLAVAGSLVVSAGCDRRKSYPQGSPQEVLASARAMVLARDTARLQELIYAEDDIERAFLARVGKLLGHLHELALEVQARFPKDLERMKLKAEAEAREAARQGRATGAGALVNQLMAAGRQTTSEQREDVAQDLIGRVFSDPYGWLEDQTGRLTTELVTDDQAAVLWDGKAILPPVGISMREVGGKWYIVPPLNLPVIARYRPRAMPEWNLWASMVKIVDNAVVEVRDEVRSGQVVGFSDVARKVGEKMFVPIAIAYVATAKYYERKFRPAPAPAR